MTEQKVRHLVHIGYHKTASTWFQKNYYPRVTNAQLIPRATVVQGMLGQSALLWDSHQARDRLGLGDGARKILCEEELSGYLHNGGLFGCLSKDMVTRLHKTLPDADIVIFIRNQADIISACYAQYIRGGGTASVNRYLWPQRYLSKGAESRYYKIPRFSFDHFDYWPLIKHYLDYFGSDRVHVFPYEAFRSNPDSFLADFEKELGLELTPDASPETKKQNVSYSLPIIHLARFLNLFTRRTVQDKYYLMHIPLWYSVRRFILESINKLPFTGTRPGPEKLLGKRNLTYITERYRDTNALLEKELGLPLEKLGYPIAPKPAKEPGS